MNQTKVKKFLSCSSGVPISTLEQVILKEGETFRVAATCRAVGLPPPRLSWDTDVPGQSQNRSSEDGVVTSQYSLHPLRNMNGRKLDCLVWHPALEQPRRLSNTIKVHCESTIMPTTDHLTYPLWRSFLLKKFFLHNFS